jgi:hypothetical protein
MDYDESPEERPRIMYGDACFIRVCPECGTFVKADEEIKIYEMTPCVRHTNATCTKHGRINMPFEGFVEAAVLFDQSTDRWRFTWRRKA